MGRSREQRTSPSVHRLLDTAATSASAWHKAAEHPAPAPGRLGAASQRWGCVWPRTPVFVREEKPRSCPLLGFQNALSTFI